MFHLKTTVAGVDVSTIDLSHTGFGAGYETCLFYRDGSSEVVAHYSTEESALAGHVEEVKRVLTAASKAFGGV